jgi:hypothetical protein
LAYKFSRVTVTPTPPDAVVFWDKRWRRSRKIAKVPWGSVHALKVSRPGCEDFEQEVTPAGEQQLAIEPALSCRPIDEGGALTITGPRRGRVVLDGVDVGRLPLQEYKLPVGSYQLEVRGRRETVRRAVLIEAGQNVTMKIKVR